MLHSTRSRLALLIAVVALALTACGSSNDPATWDEAVADGTSDTDYPVRNNFIDACETANTDEGMSADQASSYCECTFEGLMTNLDFEEFKQLDDDLRSDPESPLPDSVTEIFETCRDTSA